MAIELNEPCYFSQFDEWKNIDHTVDVRLCSICGKYMCSHCRPMYKVRMKAAFGEFKQKALVRARLMKSKTAAKSPPTIV